ncbi:hypothetical protein TI03_02955 [Achromatium sp. WMS1]|nr:hypothetical protein TI03_02955 [Achromatium sp. WMS1]
MRESRVYTNQKLQQGASIFLDHLAITHLNKVLRLRTGATIRLFNGDGSEYRGQLTTISKQRIQVQIHSKSSTIEPDPVLSLHLMLGLSRSEHMDFALQKAVELGVTRVSPLLTKRSVIQLKGERLQRRHQHWQQIIINACEQSGRCRLPQLDLLQPLNLAFNALDALDIAEDLRLVLYHLGTICLNQITSPPSSIVILIGPEGGLDPEELDFAQQQRFLPLRLGPRILRTETAPLVALAVIQALWGDFQAT